MVRYVHAIERVAGGFTTASEVDLTSFGKLEELVAGLAGTYACVQPALDRHRTLLEAISWKAFDY